jgi:hypothetical protein
MRAYPRAHRFDCGLSLAETSARSDQSRRAFLAVFQWGEAENFSLFVAADGMVVIRRPGQSFGPSSAEEFDFG